MIFCAKSLFSGNFLKVPLPYPLPVCSKCPPPWSLIITPHPVTLFFSHSLRFFRCPRMGIAQHPKGFFFQPKFSRTDVAKPCCCYIYAFPREAGDPSMSCSDVACIVFPYLGNSEISSSSHPATSLRGREGGCYSIFRRYPLPSSPREDKKQDWRGRANKRS